MFREPDFKKLLKNIEQMPKVACSRCGTIYRGMEEGFV